VKGMGARNASMFSSDGLTVNGAPYGSTAPISTRRSAASAAKPQAAAGSAPSGATSAAQP